MTFYQKTILAIRKHPARALAILPIQIGAAVVFAALMGIAAIVRFFKEL